MNGTVIAEFAYDALGRRIRKIDIEHVIISLFSLFMELWYNISEGIMTVQMGTVSLKKV